MSVIIETLNSTLQSSPDNWQCRLALVEALVSENRMDEAVGVMNQVGGLPEDLESQIMAAKAYGIVEPASGMEILDQIIAAVPNCAPAYGEKARLFLRSGDVGQAAAHYEAARGIDPSFEDAEISSHLSLPRPTDPGAAPAGIQGEVVYPEPGQYPVIPLSEAKRMPEPAPLVDPDAVPEPPEIAYQHDVPRVETMHTPTAQYIEQLHPIEVHPAPHPEGAAYDYQHPDPTMFEPTITDDDIFVAGLVTDTGESVATLQESIARNKKLKEAEVEQREKRDKFQSVLVGIVSTLLLCVAMWFVVTSAPRPNPPQVIANSYAPPTDDNMEQQTLQKQKVTSAPTQSASAMSMDVMTANSASNISMMSFDSPSLDLGASNLGDSFGSSMSFGDVGGGGSVMFFGGKSSGKRFLFVLDASASMQNEQIKLRDNELEKTLKTLRNVEYHVLLFASGGYFADKGWGVDMKKKKRGHTHFFAPWGEYTFEENNIHDYKLEKEKDFKSPDWLKASASSIRRTVKFVRESKKFVGTDWDTALKMGQLMDPPPDVIFFMSDGKDNKLDPREIIRNTKRKTKINCVAMQTAAGADRFAEIAKGTRGNFTIVDKDGEPIDGFEYMKDPGSFAGRLKF